MHAERHRWNSPALGQEMEVELYGHAGRPILAFPSQDGRVGDFAGFGAARVGDNAAQVLSKRRPPRRGTAPSESATGLGGHGPDQGGQAGSVRSQRDPSPLTTRVPPGPLPCRAAAAGMMARSTANRVSILSESTA